MVVGRWWLPVGLVGSTSRHIAARLTAHMDLATGWLASRHIPGSRLAGLQVGSWTGGM